MRKEGNPMIEAIEKATRKPLSVVMSVLLAALLVPTVPATSATAYADDEPGQGGSGTTEPEWSPIQGTDTDTGLPTLMVFKNYGFENKEVTADKFNTTLNKGLINDALADPTSDTATDKDAWNNAVSEAENAAKEDAKSVVANNESVKGKAQDDADAAVASKLNDKEAAAKYIAQAYADWYNTQLGTEGETEGKIHKAVVSKISEMLPEGAEIDGDVDIAKLTGTEEWLVEAAKKALEKIKPSATIEQGNVANDLDVSLTKYKWTDPETIDVTSVEGNGIKARIDDGQLKVEATESGDATLSFGFNFSKTLSGCGYSVNSANCTFDYTGVWKLKSDVDFGTQVIAAKYSWKMKDSSDPDQSSKEADGESTNPGGDDAQGDETDPATTPIATTTHGKGNKVPITLTANAEDFEVTAEDLNGNVNVDVDAKDSINNDNCSVKGETGVSQTGKSKGQTVKVVDLFPSTEILSGTHNDYDGDVNSLTYYTDREGQPIKDIFGGITFADGAPEEYIESNTKEALKILGQPTVAVDEWEESGTKIKGIDVEYSYKEGDTQADLNVKAVNATYCDGEKPATTNAELTWTLPEDGKTITHTVAAMVNPLEITYALDDQGFRLQECQQGKVRDDANAKVVEAIKNATDFDESTTGSDEESNTESSEFKPVIPKQNLYEAVELGNYNSTHKINKPQYFRSSTYEGIQNTDDGTLGFIRSEGNATNRAEGYGNYIIVDAPSVTVKAMDTPSWSDKEVEDLVLNADQGDFGKNLSLKYEDCYGSESKPKVWINSAPTAKWTGEKHHKLAYGFTSIPQDENDFIEEETLDWGDGTHTASIFAISDDGVISLVKDVCYNLDTMAPRVTSWEISKKDGQNKTFDSIFFQRDGIDVEFAVSDQSSSVSAISGDSESDDSKSKSEDTFGKDDIKAGENSGGVSEVKEKLTQAQYEDSEHNGSKSEFSVEEGTLSNSKSNTYSFSITGDADVSAEDIQVHVWDNAGNRLDTSAADNDSKKNIPMEYIRLVSDASDPRINVSWDTYDARHGSYYQTNRTMTITINEEFFNYVQDYANNQVITTVYRDGSEAITVHPTDFSQIGDNTWQYELSFTDDADYVVTDPTIMDIVDRTASVGGDSFTVDKTTPTMEVSFDNNNVVNGKYYQQSRTATITVNEHNFSGDLVNVQPTVSAGNGSTTGSPSVSGWSDNGDVHVATVTFPGEGVYTMTIDGVDLADNALSSYTCEEFIVDTIDPEVDITLNGATAPELSAHKGDATPAVAVHDTNISSDASASGTTIEAIGLSGAGTTTNPYEPTKSMTTSSTDTNINWANPDSSKPENDGVYQMIVTATDLSGRTTTKAVIWSVNRYGSTYRLLDNAVAMSGQYMKYSAGNTISKVKDVQVEEINPSGIDTSQASVELTKGSNNITLKKGSQYSVEPGTANDDTTGWHTYTYTVNRDNFKDSGRYQVTMHSVDNATNVSENTMSDKDVNRKSSADVSFWVDDVKPVCNIVGVENNKTYEGDSQDVTLTFEDNLKLAGATVEISDGANKTKKEYSADDLKASTTQTVKLNAAGDNQTITVSAIDAADNVSDEVSVSGVYVNSDKFLLWMHNTPLFVGSLVGGAAIIALAIFGILALIRRKNDKDEAQAA